MTSEEAHTLHVEDLVTRRLGCTWNSTTQWAAKNAAESVGEPIVSDDIFEDFAHYFWQNMGIS